MMDSSGYMSPQRSRFSVPLVGLGLILSFCLFFFWPHPPASLLLLVVAAVLAWVRLEIALALLPLTFPYYLDLQPLTRSGFPAFSLIELGLFICLGVAVARSVVFTGERRANWARLRDLWREARFAVLAGLLFLLGASLALLASPDLHESIRAYREDLLEPIAYFLLLFCYLRTLVDVARAIGALVLSAVVAGGIGIIQGIFHITSDLTYVNATTFRVDGPYGGPNNLAFLLDRTLPILLALALVGISRRSRDASSAPSSAWREPLRWVCLAVMVLLVWALYWTDSRGAELALGFVLLLLVLFEVRRWMVLAVLGVVGVVGAWVLRSRLLQLLNATGHGVVSERLLLWKAGLLIIRDHVLLGTGPDSFNTLYNPASPDSYALQALRGQPFPLGDNPQLSHPHNFVLDFWLSTGLLGLAGFLWLVGAFMVTARRVYLWCAPLREGPVLQRLLLGMVGSLVAMLVHGLVDNSYFLPDLSMLFWFFVAVLLVLQSIVLRERQMSPQRRKQRSAEEPVGAAETHQLSHPLAE